MISTTNGNEFNDSDSLLCRSENIHFNQTKNTLFQGECKIYKRRWYILLIFSLVASLNNVVWNCWTPIQGTSKIVFGWTSTDIDLLVDWGSVSYVIAVAPLAWLLDVKGQFEVHVLVLIEFQIGRHFLFSLDSKLCIGSTLKTIMKLSIFNFCIDQSANVISQKFYSQ